MMTIKRARAQVKLGFIINFRQKIIPWSVQRAERLYRSVDEFNKPSTVMNSTRIVFASGCKSVWNFRSENAVPPTFSELNSIKYTFLMRYKNINK